LLSDFIIASFGSIHLPTATVATLGS
jgi:hypothetical protein